MRKIIGQVSDGKYKSGKPSEVGNREHKGLKEFNRLYLREEFGRDIVQPFKGGQPNPEFAEAFGKEAAREHFNMGEITDE